MISSNQVELDAKLENLSDDGISRCPEVSMLNDQILSHGSKSIENKVVHRIVVATFDVNAKAIDDIKSGVLNLLVCLTLTQISLDRFELHTFSLAYIL
jgi:hypothetical protein